MVCASILIAPLLVVKKIEHLRFVNLIAITSITCFSFVVVYNFFYLASRQELADGNIFYLDIRTDYYFFIPKDFDFKSAFGALPGAILAYAW
jgi:amino acid permease